MRQEFKKRLERGDLLIGAFIILPSPEIAEMANSTIERNFTRMTVGMDILHIGESAKNNLQKLRKYRSELMSHNREDL